MAGESGGHALTVETGSPGVDIEAFRPPAWLDRPPRFTERWPALYPAAVLALRARRRIAWWRSGAHWASTRDPQPLAHRVFTHKSLLLRDLAPGVMELQHGKVTNLRLAASRMDGMLLRPGETLSFNRVVGNCTRRKGYVDGMKLSYGEAFAGVGGGICQLSNWLHWVVLHSPLTVVERSDHTFDPFPDNARVLPWGVGCSIAYNYVDLAVRNDTDLTFQLRVRVGERYLEGELRADAPPPHTYSVYAVNERFFRHAGRHFRRNEIRRSLIDRRTGRRVAEEHVKDNLALVNYVPDPALVIEVPTTGG